MSEKSNKTYTSSVWPVIEGSEGYLDANIYVVCPDGSEWRRTVSMEQGNGKICDFVTCYAKSNEDCFDDVAEAPPPVVEFMFRERLPEVVLMLRAKRAQVLAEANPPSARGYKDYTVTFKMRLGAISEELAYDALLDYLKECVENEDVTAFDFIEVGRVPCGSVEVCLDGRATNKVEGRE